MIRAIVGSALKFRGLVLGIAAAVIVVGIVTLRSAPVDVYPEFTPPYVEIQTESLGLSAAEVEQLLTVPLEADLLNGVEGVDVIRSSSLPGLSSIVLVFESGTDVYKGRQLVQERLTQLGGAAFPNVSKPPTMLQPLSSQSRVMMVALSSKDLSPIERSVITRWTVRPRLMGVPGVANVSIWGMRDQQIQVQVDPKRLADKNVSLTQIVSTAGNAQVASPVSYIEASVPGTGGFIETPHQRLQVRNVFDNIASPAELGKVPVEGTGGRLRLTDVADVVQDHQPLIGDAVVNDGDGLLLVVEKFPGADVAEVTKGVESALETLKPGLSGLRTDTSVFRPLSYLQDAIDNLALAAAIGLGLLALMLVAFLRQWRTVLIAFVTIPVSLVAAALVLDLLGTTFNAMSFAGLALALAVVIDDAVVGSENIARRLRGRHVPGATGSIVLKATHEVRSPLAYATLIALVAILPVAVMEGRPGAFLEPLALSYAAAVVAAMVVALTLTPALSLLLPAQAPGSPLGGRLGAAYDAALSRVIGSPRAVLAGAGASLAAVLLALVVMNPSLVPNIKDRGVLVHLDSQPGTSAPRMTQIATQLSSRLRKLDGVENVAAHVGRAVTGDRIVDVNSSEVVVALRSDADWDKTLAAIKRTAGLVQGVKADVVTASTQRIREVGGVDDGENGVTGDGLSLLTGSDKPLVLRLYGQDFATMRREATKLRDVMSQVDGVVDPRIEASADQPNLQISVDIDKARRYGVKPGDVRRAEAIMLQGILVGSTFKEQKVFDVIVQGTPDLRKSVAAVRNILIDKCVSGMSRTCA
jgi:Cu/Ag efflux pump CusA